MHPDSRHVAGPGHKLPRDASTPHTPGPGSSPAASPMNMASRDLTVVRIPLRRAKHHFGAASSRGSRPYNEDTDQAGTLDMPAFARRPPISLVHNPLQKPGEATAADSAFGDPQVFYFGIFDGHGGTQCSQFLRDELHGYIEETAAEFGLRSSLRKTRSSATLNTQEADESDEDNGVRDKDDLVSGEGVRGRMARYPFGKDGAALEPESQPPLEGVDPVPVKLKDTSKAIQLIKDLVEEYKSTVGGYFRRFSPEYFEFLREDAEGAVISAESVLMYSFLRADLDFVTAQARKPNPDDSRVGDIPVNYDEILGAPHHAPPSGHGIGGQLRFNGGSTASIALISTPTPAPFWHPGATSTLLIAHVGDTRAILCETGTGLARPVTCDHHPTTPTENRRLRRYAPAGTMVSGDSFGVERIDGLANSRAFGDIASKRIGVSAEPEITRVEMNPAEFSFLVLMTDGVSGTVTDQEVVDIVKEARTPEDGARNLVNYATEISTDGDNATCLVVRLGGWERRSEGGLGSLGTKEMRDMRREDALNPRQRKR